MPVGAALGSFGLAVFGLVIWLLMEPSPPLALILATAAWLAIAVLAWQVRRWLWKTELPSHGRSTVASSSDRSERLCVDMQRIFSAEGRWPTPWMDTVLAGRG
jgi:hypothetical protein